MQTYARIQDGVVAELFTTDRDIATLFHPALQWVNVTDASGTAPGSRHAGAAQNPAEQPAVASAETPSGAA